jgi:hypothetical protein
MDSSDDTNKNFFKYVFNFDDDSKSDILNIVQFALLSIIPIVILNKSISKFIPGPDDRKGSLEISAEIIIQTLVMFLGVLIIYRIITYIPSYSGKKYNTFNDVSIIIPVLLIVLSLQTKLGEKVNILTERIVELWEGKPNKKNSKGGKNGTVKVSQPISGQMMSQNMNNSAITQSLYTDGTAIGSLPTNEMMYGSQSTSDSQQLPNYNEMYKKDNTPLVGAATPGQTEGFSEPMAANAVLGGGFGSSW